MQEDPFQLEVEVALNDEVQWPLTAEGESELAQQGRPRRTRAVRQRQPRCLDMVLPGHLMVAVDVDALVEPPEACALQHAG